MMDAIRESNKKKRGVLPPAYLFLLLMTPSSHRMKSPAIPGRFRHPMYLGFVLILGGIAILLGSVTPYGIVVGFAVFIDLNFIRIEERMLEAEFGDKWMSYKAKVRRWV